MRIAGGSEKAADLRIGNGTARAPWAFLDPRDLHKLAAVVRPSPEEWFALGSLYLELRMQAEAWLSLGTIGWRPRFKKRIDRLIAASRGIDVPPGGFVYYRRQFVTGEEKERLSRGLVLLRGQWVTKEHRERVRKGYQKVRGKWTRLTARQLRQRGWELVDGQWLSPEELRQRRGQGATMEEMVTRHYILRSDRGRRFLDELGPLLEAAHAEFAGFFGARAPGTRKMVILAFKDFEGYRNYCLKIGKTSQLTALGFAPSEEYTACGYDRLRDVRSFQQTLVHEACHLFYWVTFRQNVPSWIAEGMATYFEGFMKSGGVYKFHGPARRRLAILRRQGIRFDLDFVIGSDAGGLIASLPGRAIEFYAHAWGLFYFLARSVEPAVQQLFKAVLQRARTGRPFDLKQLIGKPRLPTFQKLLLRFLRHV